MKKTRCTFYIRGAAVLALLAGCATTQPLPPDGQAGLEQAAEPEQPEPAQEPVQAVAAPQEEPWRVARSLDDLRGRWLCADGSSYEYPVAGEDGAVYLEYRWPPEDVTAEWQAMAQSWEMELDQLWAERETVRFRDEDGSPLPRADEHGAVHVVRVGRAADGAIYKQDAYLVPAERTARNLEFFVCSPDGRRFREEGVFRLDSSCFADLTPGGQVYAAAP